MKAHPIINGRPLQLGDKVRLTPRPAPYPQGGEVTDIRVRCWNKPGMEHRWIGRGPDGLDAYRDAPWEQVWIHLDDNNFIYHVEDIAEVLT